jgi:hypothetical protein
MNTQLRFIAALCALLVVPNLPLLGQTGGPQAEKEFRRQQAALVDAAKRAKEKPTALNKPLSVDELALTGIWRGPNNQIFVKWAKSDLFLAPAQHLYPEAAENLALQDENKSLKRDNPSRSTYLAYRLLGPQNRAVTVVRTAVLPQDTVNGTPELWVFRGLQLTPQEKTSGTQDLTLWPQNKWVPIHQTVSKSSQDPKIAKLKTNLEQILATTSTQDKTQPSYYPAWRALLTLQSQPHSQVHVGQNSYHYAQTPKTTSYPAHLLQFGSQSAYFYQEAYPLVAQYVITSDSTQKALLNYDLSLLAASFFGPTTAPNYNLSDDAAQWANFILLAEAGAKQTNTTSYYTQPVYIQYRGTQKATYPFALTLLQQSIFSDAQRFSTWLQTESADSLNAKLQRDPFYLLLGKMEPLAHQPLAANLNTPASTKSILLNVQAINRPSGKEALGNPSSLNSYLKGLVKAYALEEKKDGAFDKNLPLLPRTTDTRSDVKRAVKGTKGDPITTTPTDRKSSGKKSK